MLYIGLKQVELVDPDKNKTSYLVVLVPVVVAVVVHTAVLRQVFRLRGCRFLCS